MVGENKTAAQGETPDCCFSMDNQEGLYHFTRLSFGFFLLAAGDALREAEATMAAASFLLYLPPLVTFFTASLKDMLTS